MPPVTDPNILSALNGQTAAPGGPGFIPGIDEDDPVVR